VDAVSNVKSWKHLQSLHKGIKRNLHINKVQYDVSSNTTITEQEEQFTECTLHGNTAAVQEELTSLALITLNQCSRVQKANKQRMTSDWPRILFNRCSQPKILQNTPLCIYHEKGCLKRTFFTWNKNDNENCHAEKSKRKWNEISFLASFWKNNEISFTLMYNQIRKWTLTIIGCLCKTWFIVTLLPSYRHKRDGLLMLSVQGYLIRNVLHYGHNYDLWSLIWGLMEQWHTCYVEF